ncbi:MAG: hypothetical protein A2X12_10625 [Bacteroidetes bacterium GWE2_29_8]|nr:MAG: hypothetical protein A2X12_10625 [Bacteroidetes bacterium GWE2_29_8]OFY24852.1 MAG: hypothetical protein A2X02_03905 [Bacteroidetes bacterium GWF2_29_10]
MSKKQKTKDFIIANSLLAFLENGYSKLTMDEVSIILGLSKKTLYNHFRSKEELLFSCVYKLRNDLKSEIEEVINNKKLPYHEKLQKNLKIASNHISKITPKFGSDLQTNMPHIWSILVNYKKNEAVLHFSELLNEGIEQGFINKNINTSIVILMYLSAIENLLNPSYLNELPYAVRSQISFSANDIFNDIIKVIYEGILVNDAKINYKEELD